MSPTQMASSELLTIDLTELEDLTSEELLSPDLGGDFEDVQMAACCCSWCGC